MQTLLRRRRRGLARRLTWLASASLTATALFATPGIALGQTAHITLSATDAAPVEGLATLGDNWRLIVLAVVGAVAVTLRRTAAQGERWNEQTDN